MKTKLKKILDDHQQRWYDYDQEIKKYKRKIQFYQDHNFEEELRITRVKYHASQQLASSYKDMCEEIESLLEEKK